jgi:hypothetical protein
MGGRRRTRVTTGAVVQHIASLLCSVAGLVLIQHGWGWVGLLLFAAGVIGLVVSRFMVQAARHLADHLSHVDLEDSADQIKREIEAAASRQRRRRPPG